jgi:uncharacterized RmlC-like cupin family protein
MEHDPSGDKEMTEQTSDPKAKGLDRRDFLRTASVGAVAGVGAAAVGLDSEAEAHAHETTARDGRYRETAHVRRVYDLSRF